MSYLDLEVIRCSNCDTDIYLTARRLAILKSSHTTFYCSNGHSQYFPDKTALEKENEDLKRSLTIAQASAKRAIEHSTFLENELRLNAHRCEHCKRRFQSDAKLGAHFRRVHGKTLRLVADVGK